MKVDPIPKGYHTITPYFAVRNAPRLIEFLHQAFDAEEIERHSMPDGTVVNAQVKVGTSMVLVAELPKDSERAPMVFMFYMYVEDADGVYAQAIRAGGKSIQEPADQFYGDRSGAVEDPAGNQWWIATHKEEISADELIRRASQRNS